MPTSNEAPLAWLTLPARRESFEKFRNFVMSSAASFAPPSGVLGKIDLALEEVLLNVMDYAYAPQQEGNMDVGCGRLGKDFFRVVVRDQGRPFNPLLQQPPDLTAGVEAREVGGLGVFLTTRMTDRLNYRRENATNILEMDFRLAASS